MTTALQRQAGRQAGKLDDTSPKIELTPHRDSVHTHRRRETGREREEKEFKAREREAQVEHTATKHFSFNTAAAQM